MLDRVHLSNFKCFSELTLPLRPLTLLTGFNASGKSTALQPLLLMAQALRSADGGRDVALNGSLVRLGTPGEVLREDPGGKVRSLSIGAGAGRSDMVWKLGAEDRGAEGTLRLRAIELSGRGKAVELEGWRDQGRLDEPDRELLAKVRSVVYLSAVRGGAVETFPAPDAANPTNADVGPLGEFATWWFERRLDDEVPAARRHPREQGTTLRRQFNAWAAELFPGADANALRIPRTSLLRLELRTRTTEDYRRPAHIGYGLTYAFPILVALLLADEGQTVVIDSPEAHLHPSGQSAMGVILARFAAAGVQIVVETHSDHLLNGVRRAASTGLVPSGDVAIHFFTSQADDRGSQVTSIAVDATGALDDWPAGFFDQADIDLTALAGWDGA